MRTVISTMTSRHNLGDYERARLGWHHVPVTLLGVDYGAVQPRSPIAASTSSGRSVTT